MSDNKAQKNMRSENKRKSTYLWRETGEEEEMQQRKVCWTDSGWKNQADLSTHYTH